jgi:hypothetical protein
MGRQVSREKPVSGFGRLETRKLKTETAYTPLTDDACSLYRECSTLVHQEMELLWTVSQLRK